MSRNLAFEIFDYLVETIRRPALFNMKSVPLLSLVLVLGGWLSAGCAFDISHIDQQSATLAPVAAPQPPWTLRHAVSVYVGSGFSTDLKAGTRWTLVGHIAAGDVCQTRDQIVEVESSNMYEAYLVLNDSKIAGFYLPVEHSFVAARPPVAIALASP
jgi:hypothetical protein